MTSSIQSRYPRVPYFRFAGEVAEVPYAGEDGCGCRATSAEIAVVLATAGETPAGAAHVHADGSSHTHATPLPSSDASTAHGSEGSEGADTSEASAGSPVASGVTTNPESRSATGEGWKVTKGKGVCVRTRTRADGKLEARILVDPSKVTPAALAAVLGAVQP